MSKKHVEEQKLLIENFNKWINEDKCGEKEIEETSGHYMEAEPIEEDEELDEGIIAAMAVTTYIASKTMINSVLGALSLYDKLMSANKQIQNDPNAPEQLKKDSQVATVELADVANKLQSITKKLGWSPDKGLDTKSMSDEQMQQLLAALYNLKPKDSEEQLQLPDKGPKTADQDAELPSLMSKYTKLKNKVDK